MKCESVQDRLLQCENLRPKSWPREMRHHVKACSACYEFAKSLKRLEKAWCDQPLPSQARKPRPKFLKRIARLERPAPLKPLKPASRSWRPVRWLSAVAAVLIVGMGGLALLVFVPSESQASDDVVDGLLEWNTRLSHADFGKRKQLLEEHEDTFRKRLQNARRLSTDERANGELLLAAARDLVASDDLEEDEEIINGLAEKLLERAKDAEKKGNKKATEIYSRRYVTFVDKAVNPLKSKLSIIDRLIAWNMEMANADAKTRKELLEQNESALQAELNIAKLPAEEHAMAEKLLEVGRRLAANPDPLGQAEALTDAADKLLARVETAEKKGKTKESNRCGVGYSMFIEKTVNPFFDKLKAMQPKTPPDPKKSSSADLAKQKQYENIWSRMPQFNRPEMQKKYEGPSKKGFSWPSKYGSGGGGGLHR